jgi:MiaB-like tRNA modifying enzyme
MDGNKGRVKSDEKTSTCVFLETYGCTLNQSDSDVIRNILETHGYSIAQDESSADVVIINTCTVKGATENKIITRIESLVKRKKPVVIAGCMSANEKLIKRIAPSAPIVGTISISHIADAVRDALNGVGAIYKSREDKAMIFRPSSAPIMRIPICEGCTSNCYFCQTKIARPFLFSYKPKTIARWVENAIENGAKEIQLTAMDSGVYGIDLGTNLAELLKNICAIDGEFRVRLGMINPQHAKRLGDDLINALMHEKMYKFLHVPVQTGSEDVCRAMNRQHTVADFVEVVKNAREKISDITIATDIIVGYPTETDEDFEKTIKLIKVVKPDIVNISKFSPREGTVAKKLKQLPTQVIAKRSRELTTLVKEIAREKNKALIGKYYNVLVTEKQKNFTGRTMSYKQVVLRNFKGSLGEFVKVEIEDANHGSLFGRCVK